MSRALGVFTICAASLLLSGCDDAEVVLEDGSTVGKDAYIEANVEVVDSLPVFPGADLESTESSPYFGGDSEDAPVSGYTTHARYRVPEGATDEEVVSFYLESMDGWEGCRDQLGIIEAVERGEPTRTPFAYIVLAHFSQGETTVHIDTSSLSRTTYEGRFDVTVDHKGDPHACGTPPAASP